MLVDDASLTGDENAGDLLEITVLYGLLHFAEALCGKSFLGRISSRDCIAIFLCENVGLQDQYCECHIRDN